MALDWRDGWFDGRIAPGRTSDVFCEQVRAAVARSKDRGRVAIIITDNLKTHTAQGSLLVRSMLADARTHFETLSRTPDVLLRHTGSPFAPDKRFDRPQVHAA